MLYHHAKLLGYAGLIPFIAIPFYILWGYISFFEGISFYSQYSAIILSFLGGILWFDAITRTHSKMQLYFAMLPSLIGWFALILFPPVAMLTSLGFAFLLILLYEFSVLDLAPWYRSLRIRLSTIVLGGHAMMIWLVFQYL